jgi:hypothetical protein
MQISEKRRDVATVFSLLPVPLLEKKPGLYPSEFRIPATTERGDFNVLLVEEGIHYVPQLEHPAYRASTPAGEIARSIVQDYKEGSLGLDEDAEPGLFWTYGVYSKELAKIELRVELHEAVVKQSRWFVNLVRIADVEWAQHPGNHNVITVLMRHAATALGLEKEWLVNPDNLALVYCPVCRNNVSPKAVVCGSCHAILRPEDYKKYEFASR